MRVKRTSKGKGIVEVTEADYQAQLARIKDEDAVLKPGRYRYERGGFNRRHPDFVLPPNQVKISILPPEQFDSYKEAAEYCNTHDTTDYLGESRTVEPQGGVCAHNLMMDCCNNAMGNSSKGES